MSQQQCQTHLQQCAQATVDGYLTYLSESTHFDEDLTHTELKRRGYAHALMHALRLVGAEYQRSYQVWGSDCGFYKFTFEDVEDDVSIVVRNITPTY